MAEEPHITTSIRWPDWATEPMTELALARLLERGLPPDAVREDRTLDPEVLARHGWYLDGAQLYGP